MYAIRSYYAQRLDPEKALVVDVGYLETDFVVVSGEHHARTATGVDDGVRIAVRVGPDLVQCKKNRKTLINCGTMMSG